MIVCNIETAIFRKVDADKEWTWYRSETNWRKGWNYHITKNMNGQKVLVKIKQNINLK